MLTFYWALLTRSTADPVLQETSISASTKEEPHSGDLHDASEPEERAPSLSRAKLSSIPIAHYSWFRTGVTQKHETEVLQFLFFCRRRFSRKTIPCMRPWSVPRQLWFHSRGFPPYYRQSDCWLQWTCFVPTSTLLKPH